MSIVGKNPIEIPDGVDTKLDGDMIRVKGPRGDLSHAFPKGVMVVIADGKILVERSSDAKKDKELHGLTRSLIFNMVNGISQGYKRIIEIKGIGYKAQVKGSKLIFALGHSHPVEYEVPKGVNVAVDDKQVTITLSGIDKQLLGQVAANIKKLRVPDAYKGKGIRYAGERLKLKAGKTGKK
ncbi:MAG: 50S ribosomal protein L6 [Thermodesulfovibrionales bacterium]|nr:50S ribosomal protein L6 [Thermodesulfovibrionales bacterium]